MRVLTIHYWPNKEQLLTYSKLMRFKSIWPAMTIFSVNNTQLKCGQRVRARVQSLVGELKSHKPRGMAKKKKCGHNLF